jgi:hypothetical protein
MDDVYVSPYERTRGRGKRDLGLRASVIMRVVAAWASHSWAHREGKSGPESESKGYMAHDNLSSRSPDFCRWGTPGRVVCLYIYQVSQLIDGWRNLHFTVQ